MILFKIIFLIVLLIGLFVFSNEMDNIIRKYKIPNKLYTILAYYIAGIMCISIIIGIIATSFAI